MAQMTKYIQRVASGPKQRFRDPETDTDLDLSYISDNIIIMGYPTPANNYQAVFRNNQDQVRKLLESRHGRNWRIYNLCPCHENKYDPAYFYNQVVRYPFPDHHAPPLALIKVAVKNMGRYLSENAENVVVVHCKAGKGRSGTIACCLLLTLAELPPPSRHVSNRPRHSYYPSGNEIDADQSRPSQLKTHQGHAKSDASAVQRLVEPHIIPSAASSTSHLTTTEATENSNSTLPPALERAEDVLKLHTHRRMKTKESNKTKEKDVSRWRMGVSIPSQRRFIEYFARELANEVVHNSHNVRVWRVTVRLSENFGKLAKTIVGLGNTRLCLHFARYTDDYVEALQDGVNNDDESFSIQDDRWDKEKMVHRFAETDEYTTEEDDQGIKTLTFTPEVILNSSRECRLRLVYGQVSIGWIWFIPDFHESALIITNEQIDFTKGALVGISLVDVKVEI